MRNLKEKIKKPFSLRGLGGIRFPPLNPLNNHPNPLKTSAQAPHGSSTTSLDSMFIKQVSTTMHKSNVLQKYKIEKLLFYDEKYIEKLPIPKIKRR